jgi:hypothetical protein
MKKIAELETLHDIEQGRNELCEDKSVPYWVGRLIIDIARLDPVDRANWIEYIHDMNMKELELLKENQ